jgi:hypothetical protein
MGDLLSAVLCGNDREEFNRKETHRTSNLLKRNPAATTALPSCRGSKEGARSPGTTPTSLLIAKPLL